jgi:hypothetical protein
VREREFEQWLIQGYRTASGESMTATTCQSRFSNCKTLERHEGDLDAHFAADRLQALLGRMIYSKDDERLGLPAKHRIPINGNVYNGTATLRSALNLYVQFCKEWPTGAEPPALFVEPQRPAVRSPRQSSKWPEWNVPTEEDVLRLARITIPYVRFLHLQIVGAVVEDNERHRAAWGAGLGRRGVDPDAYLWPRCACAFPGVRRYVGSKEIAQHRKQSEAPQAGYDQALQLDDNNYPKHLWSFAFRGRPFQQFGPKSYALAHLIDHKVGKRLWDEIEAFDVAPYRLSWLGLYTSAANSVYAPTSLIKPTDFVGPLRNLLQRRAASLYGGFCNILPPGLRIRAGVSGAWELDAFDWSDPVGSITHIDTFLAFRNETIERFLSVNNPIQPA